MTWTELVLLLIAGVLTTALVIGAAVLGVYAVRVALPTPEPDSQTDT